MGSKVIGSPETGAETTSKVDALLRRELDSLFWKPSRSGSASAWWGHVPFAHWFTAIFRPTILVELGTHNGVSFAAFCESILRSKSASRCFAVDTWEGDAHAGFYGEDVFENLNRFVQYNYSSFAELIKTTFDNAVSYFDDATIDLLHIDGLHTYEAVRHDFETWLPKLSSRAVVIFHDTNVRERGFGVWKFWQEVRTQYPSFEFLHGHGLGILAVGAAQQAEVQELCELNPTNVTRLRDRFASLGARWIAADQNERTAQHLHDTANQAGHTEASYRHQIEALQAELLLGSERIIKQEELLTSLEAEKQQLESRVADTLILTSEMSSKINFLENELDRDRLKLHQIYGSNSWRVTGILRGLRSLTRIPSKAAAARAASSEKNSRPAIVSEADVMLVESSRFFDAAEYLRMAGKEPGFTSPAKHYLEFGENQGISPSSLFDPTYYRNRYPDITSGTALVHYILHGQSEGRSPRPKVLDLELPLDRLDSRRRTIIVALHEATRTGAPILGLNIIKELQRRYNVVTLLRRGGILQQSLSDASNAVVVLPDDFELNNVDVDSLVEALVERYRPVYVVANSVETRQFVPGFEQRDTPVVALVHEFSSSVGQRGALSELYQSASQIVFPAHVVANASLKDYPNLHSRAYHVIAQGPSQLPSEDGETGRSVDMKLAQLPSPSESTILVVGIGTITMRKGVEFFIAAAAEVARRCGNTDIQFAWVGNHSSFDQQYMDSLLEQISRSKLHGRFHFLGEFANLDSIYKRADICFLSSRLDPLPNVSIDCALHGIPIVCFENASGLAEMFVQSEDTCGLVVPYLESGAAAEVILRLAKDADLRVAASSAVRKFAAKHFDLPGYVSKIDELALASVDAVTQVKQDHEVIMHSGGFNLEMYCGVQNDNITLSDAVTHYLQASRRAAPRGRPSTGVLVRRPLEGFHPLVYASANRQYNSAETEDPLAHYIRTGYPSGRWSHSVLRPDPNRKREDLNLKVGVHGHFHYPELLPDFIRRLAHSRVQVDLMLTTSSESRAKKLENIISEFGFESATVSIFPNRGRDIGPLFSGLSRELLGSYDVIGHFHGKRSPHVEEQIGERWRNFLWEHLVGGEFAMVDEIVDAFQQDDRLGLVFAEDPHLNDWNDNREIANDLAERMGMPLPLPNHFDFPQGTMFWARPAIFKPIQRLNLVWDDYPSEPLDIDGTMLHALERLLPLCAAQEGYHYSTTYLRNCTR